MIGDDSAADTGYFWDRRGLNVTYTGGGMSFGLGVLSQCTPDCPGTVQEDQTIVVHFMAKFGALNLGVYHAAASAVDTGTNADADASATDINGVYALEKFKVGFELSIYTDSVDAEGMNAAIGGDIGPLEFHYVTRERENAAGTKTTDTSEISLAYLTPIGDKGSLAVGYAQYGSNIVGQEQNDTLLIVSGKLTF